MTLPWWVFWLGLFGISTLLGVIGYIFLKAGQKLTDNKHLIGILFIYLGGVLHIPGVIGVIFAYGIKSVIDADYNESKQQILADGELIGFEKGKKEATAEFTDEKKKSDLALEEKTAAYNQLNYKYLKEKKQYKDDIANTENNSFRNGYLKGKQDGQKNLLTDDQKYEEGKKDGFIEGTKNGKEEAEKGFANARKQMVEECEKWKIKYENKVIELNDHNEEVISAKLAEKEDEIEEKYKKKISDILYNKEVELNETYYKGFNEGKEEGIINGKRESDKKYQKSLEEKDKANKAIIAEITKNSKLKKNITVISIILLLLSSSFLVYYKAKATVDKYNYTKSLSDTHDEMLSWKQKTYDLGSQYSDYNLIKKELNELKDKYKILSEDYIKLKSSYDVAMQPAQTKLQDNEKSIYLDEHISFVWVADNAVYYHTYNCENGPMTQGGTYMAFNTEYAEYLGYIPCPKCHGE